MLYSFKLKRMFISMSIRFFRLMGGFLFVYMCTYYVKSLELQNREKAKSYGSKGNKLIESLIISSLKIMRCFK